MFPLVLVTPDADVVEAWLFLLDHATVTALYLVTLFEMDSWHPDKEDWNHSQRSISQRNISKLGYIHIVLLPIFSPLPLDGRQKGGLKCLRTLTIVGFEKLKPT